MTWIFLKTYPGEHPISTTFSSNLHIRLSSTQVVGTHNDLNRRLRVTTFVARDRTGRLGSRGLVKQRLGGRSIGSGWLGCLGASVTRVVTPVMVVVVMVTPAAVVFDHRVSLDAIQALLAPVFRGRGVDHRAVNRSPTLATTARFTVGWRVLGPRGCQVRVDVLHGLVVGRRGSLPASGKRGAQEREETGGRSGGGTKQL